MGDSESGRSRTTSTPSLSPPCPRSPPSYPDLYGKRRELAKLQMREREGSFLLEELKLVEGIPPASKCCKDFSIAAAATAAAAAAAATYVTAVARGPSGDSRFLASTAAVRRYHAPKVVADSSFLRARAAIAMQVDALVLNLKRYAFVLGVESIAVIAHAVYATNSRTPKNSVALAEWLRRVPAKYMGFPRESSNLSGDVMFNIFFLTLLPFMVDKCFSANLTDPLSSTNQGGRQPNGPSPTKMLYSTL
ncbi:hypothetical protein Nepgr_019949 [Nepenthes gracilis]|uniref:Uncharacterized protein n=1 Tax=Nepenthes gracilis TaxID=150966 RepID=A0AAD3SUA5_NEPGR|nr:hypothetical protein Nepgr_019949 [Nepenthes gracilis]